MKKFFSLVAVALVAMAANAQEMVMTDLTLADYHVWTSWEPTAEMTDADVTPLCNYKLNESTDMPYGNGSVTKEFYAKLDEYDVLVAVASAGEPRFLLNRDIDDGQAPDHLIAIPNDAAQTAAYETVVDNGDGTKTFTIDIAKIVEDKGFAHLHTIKGANWANVTLVSLQVGKMSVVGLNSVETAVAQGQCFNILGQRVNKLEQGQIYIVNGKKFVNK